VSSGRSDYLVEVWDTDRGLPNVIVMSVAQTPDSYLRVATFEGLASFDGVSFRVTNKANTPGFPGNFVSTVYCDREGRLWASTYNGLATWRGGRWRVLGQADGWRTAGVVKRFSEDREGGVLAAVADRLFRFAAGRFSEIPLPDGGQGDAFADADGALWARGEHYLGRRAGDRWIATPLPAGSAGPIVATQAARGGGVWVAWEDGVQRFRSGVWEPRQTLPPDLRLGRGTFLFEDSEGHLWVQIPRKGLAEFRHNGRVLLLGRPEGMPTLAIRSLTEDREKNLWVGTDGGGLVRLRPRTAAMFDTTHGLGADVVNTVYEDGPNRLLVADYGGGLMYLDRLRQRFTPFEVRLPEVKPGGAHLTIAALRDSSGDIWAGTLEDGLFHVHRGAAERIPPSEIGAAPVRAIFEDSRKTLWFGVSKGLYARRDGKFRAYGAESGIRPGAYTAIAEDGRGAIWVGGDAGLFERRGDRFERIYPEREDERVRVYAIRAAGDGSLWFGTADHGLGQVRDGKIFLFGGAQGFPSPSVGAILEDDEARLWMTTATQGLLCVSTASLEAVAAGRQRTLDPIWLNKSDGLNTNNMRISFQPAAVRSRDGKLWFATLRGLAMVDPKQVQTATPSPPVWIEQVTAGGEQLKDLDRGGAEGVLTVPADRRLVRIAFSAPSFTAPERLRFRYRVDGLTSEWQEQSSRSVTFANLRPASYVFHVQVRRGGGAWSEQEARVSLRALPFWWETIWFRLLTFAALAVLAGGIVYAAQGRRLQRKTWQFERERELRLDLEKMQEGLRSSEEKLSKFFNASPLSVAVIALAERRIRDANQAFLRCAGCRREELIGTPLSQSPIAIEPVDRERLRQLLDSGEPIRDVEVTVRVRGGEPRLQALSVEPIELDGESCLLVVANDITERRQLEGLLQEAGKMEAVGRLAGGVAHDFNNLLTVINGYTDLLLSSPQTGASAASGLEQIRMAGERAAGLTHQLLAFSRKQVVKPRAVDVNQAAIEAERLLRRVVPEDIEIVLELEETPAVVMADPGQLHQILMNLMVNARDAMPEGGRLTVSISKTDLSPLQAAAHPAAPPGAYVMLAVADTGAGMDAATRQRVFEPFFTTKKSGRGTGLGLATVYGVVRQSGGLLEVASEPGKGTVFTVYLPLAECEAEASEPEIRDAPPGTETVLLVEDQDEVRRFTQRALEACGYCVLEACNGEQALAMEAVYAAPIELLLTDVVMPGMTGPELARRMRPLRPDMRVLFCSGYTDLEGTQRGATGDSPFLQKPFTPRELAAKVREVLDAPHRHD
jgi:PAS domain S-box-containing protein